MPRLPVTLFRLGNATGPQMDKVRPKDISIYDVSGELWVRSGTGGISTSAAPGPLAGHWWRIEAGFAYHALLFVWNDRGQHWSWEPIEDMGLSAFQALLQSTHADFIKLTQART